MSPNGLIGRSFYEATKKLEIITKSDNLNEAGQSLRKLKKFIRISNEMSKNRIMAAN